MLKAGAVDFDCSFCKNKGEGPKKKNFEVKLNVRDIMAGGSSKVAPEETEMSQKTFEPPPKVDFYRNSVSGTDTSIRPSLAQLIHGSAKQNDEIVHFDDKENKIVQNASSKEQAKEPQISKLEAPKQRTKFGWIEGVLVRCIQNIFGVMLFLRISWVAGQAGILLGCGVVLLASTVTTITALSTCAICTNGEVKGGGAYFLISRSLGPEFGGSIGLIFSVANAVGGAMYIIGFGETVRDMLVEYSLSNQGLADFIESFGSTNIVRVIAAIACILLVGAVFVGNSFESKIQIALLVIVMSSVVDYFLGTLFISSNEYMELRGNTGYSWNTMMENMFPAFRGQSFFTVFAIYFPAATGIMAGANISGDLKDPQKAIPLGTLLAILITTMIYLGLVWSTGATVVRDADGISAPVFDALGAFVAPNCTTTAKGCKYGLMNYFQILDLGALWSPLILVGIWTSTLSSGLISLMSAPKVFQAVSKDHLFPKIGYFAKGFGRNEEPRRAYLLAGIIALGIIMIGDLNAIAPLISNFFLASYALLNYACFDLSFADSPGFRPAFRFYNMWVSLLGAIICIGIMFVINWITALLTFFFFGILFMYLLHRKPDVNWGSSTQAHSYRNALANMVKLSSTEEHVKNYRPQILVLSGNPAARPPLIDFVYNITKGNSLMMCGHVVPYAPSDGIYSILRKLDRSLNDWLMKKSVKAFYTSVASVSLRQGVRSFYQIAGLGKLRPNIVVLGFRSRWAQDGPTHKNITELNEYFGVIQDAFEAHLGLAVLRNGDEGLDYSEQMHSLREVETSKNTTTKRERKQSKLYALTASTSLNAAQLEQHLKVLNKSTGPESVMETDENADAAESDSESTESSYAKHFPEDLQLENDSIKKSTSNDIESCCEHDIDTSKLKNELKATLSFKRTRQNANDEGKEILGAVCRFQQKIKKGIIDVWWLYDDGGLTLLLPHLLTIPKSYLEGANLRVFTLSTSSVNMQAEQKAMVALLSRFRIDISDVSVLDASEMTRKPSPTTMDEFEGLIRPFIADSNSKREGFTSPQELATNREKTCRQLRLSELLQRHSKDSNLVVITLPVPRKGMVSASLYLSWLDMMTRDLPPCLLVRGNQQSVLTFYS